MYIPIFKMKIMKQEWQLIQQGDYAFSINLQDADLHVSIVKISLFFYFIIDLLIDLFLHLGGKINHINGRFCNFD